MTNILLKSPIKNECFEDIEVGTPFIFEGGLFVKTSPYKNGVNSVAVCGSMQRFFENTIVTIVDEIVCKF